MEISHHITLDFARRKGKCPLRLHQSAKQIPKHIFPTLNFYMVFAKGKMTVLASTKVAMETNKKTAPIPAYVRRKEPSSEQNVLCVFYQRYYFFFLQENQCL